ncbi:MAG: hypothetical protein QW115_02550 [Thermoplasmata archaeon]
MEKKRVLPVVLLTAVAVIATFLLFLYSVQLKPEFVPLSEISREHIGKRITTEGMLGKCRFEENYVKGAVQDSGGNSRIGFYAVNNAFADFKRLNPLPGAKLRLTGVVKEYGGEIEIYLSEANSIEVLETPGSLYIPIEELLENPERFKGLYLNTSGRISSIATLKNSTDGRLVGTQIEITDGNYTLSCIAYNVCIQTDCNGMPLEKGSYVLIFGQFNYNSRYGRWNLVFTDEKSIMKC